MREGWPWRRHVSRLLLRGALCGVAFALLALMFTVAHVPAVRAAGPGCYAVPVQEEHSPTRPAIHLDRSEGPVGMKLQVSASGWRPGAHITLRFDGREPTSGKLYVLSDQAARGTVASDGTVTIITEVPSYVCTPSNISDPGFQFDARGGETGYFVLTSDDGAVSAPTSFRYLPAPIVVVNTGGANAQQVKVGSTITVTGTGWESYEPLTISLRSADPADSAAIPYARETHITSDSRGIFTTSYPLDARLPWNRAVLVTVVGTGPRFGALEGDGYIFLLPAIQPTFHVDQTVVTPGMAITVSGERWYPGQTFTIKYCAAWLTNHGWDEGPDCGKAANPALGNVTIDAQGRMRQRFTIPADEPPGVIMVRVNEVAGWINVPEIVVHVVDHLPTWDEIHPRVAALRDKLLGSLPFTVPTMALLGALVVVAIRRGRGRRTAS